MEKCGDYRTRGGKVKKHIVRIPADVSCRIALASDLHNADGRGALNVLREGRPDLISITGDLFMGYSQGEERGLLETQKNILHFVRGCVAIAPTYISLGNHEWLATEQDYRVLTRAGAVILDNEWTEVTLQVPSKGGKRVPGAAAGSFPVNRKEDPSQGGEQFLGSVAGSFSVNRKEDPSEGDERISGGAAGSFPVNRKEDPSEGGERISGGAAGSFPVNRKQDHSEGGECIKLLIGGMTSGLLMDYRLFRMKYGNKTPYPHEVRHTNFSKGIPEAGWLDDFEAQEGYKILLCHHPEYWKLQYPLLSERRINLTLAGHAHGGQIRIFGRGLFAPGQGMFPKYTSGVHWGPYGRMVISRGLSNTAPRPIPRLFNPPEIVFVELGR